MPRRWLLLAMAAVALVSLWGGYRVVAARQLRAALDQAERDMAAHRLGAAHNNLKELAARWRGHSEVEYHLGLCEQVRGQTDAALAAWSRVPAGSPFAVMSMFSDV